MASVEALLEYLHEHGQLESLHYAAQTGDDHQKVVGLIKSLHSHDQLINTEQVSSQRWQLTDEGCQVALEGSHEVKVFEAVPPDGVPLNTLMSSVPNAQLGFSYALKCGWLVLDKQAAGGAGLGAMVRRKVQSVTDVLQHHLRALQADPATTDVSDKLKLEYKKRKLLTQCTVKSYRVTKGAAFSLTVEKADADLTAAMIASGDWAARKFKPYNFNALGAPLPHGHLHPLLKVRSEFRQIFLEMGFSEMPTNRFVESSFWNFDALFQPQQHPARDAQDTFFLTEPATSCRFPGDYVQRVADQHTRGYGSLWKYSDAQKNILRTHTTAVSARLLYQLAQNPEFKPVRYFSIDRVFRNETLDATHLAEFHQIEGVVADRGLSLSHLMGVIAEFFKKLGIDRIRFKPAYNPYTEPSMEIFSWHPGLCKWVEVGNSGMFRPEMLLPMGLPDDVSVIAWGLSLERPTMIMYGVNNIRDLCGHRVNLQMVAESPICRLDKSHTEDGQARVKAESQLERLQRRQQALLHDIAGLQPLLHQATHQLTPTPTSPAANFSATLHMDPSRPPYSVLALLHAVLSKQQQQQQLQPPADQCALTVYCHSSCDNTACPPLPPALNGRGAGAGGDACPRRLVVVWRRVPAPRLLVAASCQPVAGEVAVLRVLARHLATATASGYCDSDSVAIDQWLDRAELAAEAASSGDSAPIQALAAAAAAISGHLVDKRPSLADLYVRSVLKVWNSQQCHWFDSLCHGKQRQ